MQFRAEFRRADIRLSYRNKPDTDLARGIPGCQWMWHAARYSHKNATFIEFRWVPAGGKPRVSSPWAAICELRSPPAITGKHIYATSSMASSHSGHLHGIGPHNQEPGRTLIPGDGAVGDQMAQNRPVCPTMAATRTPAASPVSTTSWRYGLRRTFRLVTRRSHRPRSTWPDQARLAFLAVTHRHKRTNCLWLEPFQIADSGCLLKS
jgi:hypothetical protein